MATGGGGGISADLAGGGATVGGTAATGAGAACDAGGPGGAAGAGGAAATGGAAADAGVPSPGASNSLRPTAKVDEVHGVCAPVETLFTWMRVALKICSISRPGWRISVTSVPL